MTLLVLFETDVHRLLLLKITIAMFNSQAQHLAAAILGQEAVKTLFDLELVQVLHPALS